MNYPSESNSFHQEHVAIICQSYRKLLGVNLVEADGDYGSISQALFYAPFAVLSHTADADPLFNYVNLKALELFEFSWDEFIGLPSRLSAAPACQSDRDKLLKAVGQYGFIKDYQGIRIARTGKKFMIKDAVVWNLLDDEGRFVGQAACLKDWTFL
jgi:MEKHLA domain